ncbi:hypothetical protein N7G274_004611 [Stereocaulon virgatum]|uniref:Uncharacterized protein n=1 Tax=Stereocaulon virgatum TaxID=373712 RepID=A0ABR4ABL8_9LECA
MHSRQDDKRIMIPVCCARYRAGSYLTIAKDPQSLPRGNSSVPEGHQRLAFVTTNPAKPDQKPSKPPAEVFSYPFIDNNGPKRVIKTVSSQSNFTDEAILNGDSNM